MKLCLLADAGSVHTQRWAAAHAERGHEVTVLSLRPGDLGPVPVVDLSPPRRMGKLGYLAVANKARALLGRIRPDLVHAHYATSYGLLGALSRYHPFIISVWGSDVFDFPRRSPIHAMLLRYNLGCADMLASTSQCMRAEVAKYTHKEVVITPFGIDTTLFTSRSRGDEGHRFGEVTIGLVKALEKNYGISVLVDAFELLARVHSDLRLLIVGGGSESGMLEAMIQRSPFASRIRLMEPVPHALVPQVLHSMDIFAMPSDSESFGVAALEASACGLPVVASRVGGLPEVVIDGETGVLVPPRDPAALAYALQPLVESAELRCRLGENGRAFVEREYSWPDCVDMMERAYSTVRGIR
jgi:L-malate glycosyltransferase